jgi:phosphate-selective porin OprO/OprP
MSSSVWKRASQLAAGGLVAFLLAAGTVRAADPEDPGVADIRARIEQLEKRNAQMLKEVQDRQQTPVATEAPAGAVTQQDVQKIVSDALKDQQAKKQASDAQAKAADDQAKKDAPAKWYEVGSDLNMKAYWKDGLHLGSSHKDFDVHLGGWFQQDWIFNGERGSIQADPTVGVLQDFTAPRRIRLDMDGYAWEVVEFALEWLFENNPANQLTANQVTSVSSGTVPAAGNNPATQFNDLWAGLKALPVIGNIRVGHVRDPIGLENYSTERATTFMERTSNFDAFYQKFQPGVWGFNSWYDERLNLAWSVTRPDPNQFDVDVGNGDYCLTGRIAGLPFYANEGRCLLHLGAAYQYRTGQFDPAVGDHDFRFRARPDLQELNFIPRLIDTGTIVADRADFLGLEALLILGPLNVQSEYTQVWVNNGAVGGSSVGDLTFNGWYVTVGYFLTGEARGYDKRLLRLQRSRPLEPFFWVKDENGHHHWGLGALEVAFRYDQVDLDSGGVRGGVQTDYTLGLNWYLTDMLKFQANYIIADRHVDPPKASGTLQFVGLRVMCTF